MLICVLERELWQPCPNGRKRVVMGQMKTGRPDLGPGTGEGQGRRLLWDCVNIWALYSKHRAGCSTYIISFNVDHSSLVLIISYLFIDKKKKIGAQRGKVVHQSRAGIVVGLELGVSRSPHLAPSALWSLIKDMGWRGWWVPGTWWMLCVEGIAGLGGLWWCLFGWVPHGDDINPNREFSE